MAGPITHAIFGREVLRQLEDQEIQQFLHNNSVAYHWGLQGPDPYFTVLKGDNGMIGVFGLMMHLKETERSFEAIGRYLLEHRDDPMFDSLLAFGMGYLGHYALDKKVHQFVYPRDKAYQKEHPEFAETHNVHELHGLIEDGLEWQIYACKKLPGETAQSILAPYGEITDALCEAINGLFVYIGREVYGVDATKTSYAEASSNLRGDFGRQPGEENIFMEDHLNHQSLGSIDSKDGAVYKIESKSLRFFHSHLAGISSAGMMLMHPTKSLESIRVLRAFSYFVRNGSGAEVITFMGTGKKQLAELFAQNT